MTKTKTPSAVQTEGANVKGIQFQTYYRSHCKYTYNTLLYNGLNCIIFNMKGQIR